MLPKNLMPPIHPGEILAEDLEELGLSTDELDRILTVPAGTALSIVKEKRGIDVDFALRLGRYLGTGARLWMNLQVSYDLKVAAEKVGPQILREVTPRPDIVEIPEEWERD